MIRALLSMLADGGLGCRGDGCLEIHNIVGIGAGSGMS